MKTTIKPALAALAILSTPLLTACGGAEDEAPETATVDDGTITLGTALADQDELATLQDAMSESELAGLLDGPASYTLLAPTNAAFEALGEQGTALLSEESNAVLLGVLRDHILPGHITPEQIEDAIASKGGPVIMTTYGGATATFSQGDGGIDVTLGEGTPARITGPSVAANNGVVIPVDAVLMPPEEG